MSDFAVFAEGITDLGEIRNAAPQIRAVAAQAINTIARNARADAARRIQDQINIPARQVGPGGGLLTVTQSANRASLEARITARGRPTSLARYVQGNPTPGRAGVSVSVKPGQSTYLKRAFIVKLPGTGGSTEGDNFNRGLAIRVAPGERISNKIDQVRLAKGLYLLYGPSIQQVFLDNQGGGVADDIAEPTAVKLEAEFLRRIRL